MVGRSEADFSIEDRAEAVSTEVDDVVGAPKLGLLELEAVL